MHRLRGAIILALVLVAACTTLAPAGTSPNPITPEPVPTASPSPTPTPDPVAAALAACAGTGAPSGDPVTLQVAARSVAFTVDRLEGARHCEPFRIVFENEESIEHNVAIFPEHLGLVPLFRQDPFVGPKSVVYEPPPLPAGTYRFVCTAHLDAMQGTLVVEG